MVFTVTEVGWDWGGMESVVLYSFSHSRKISLLRVWNQESRGGSDCRHSKTCSINKVLDILTPVSRRSPSLWSVLGKGLSVETCKVITRGPCHLCVRSILPGGTSGKMEREWEGIRKGEI